ncbi:pentapeptide repeat-containing protein [Streptomyces spirodelae]|uniref:Pentapeptide repeat-containing protein n=1 Tax=Streptomyces spirodelae TaxID=2812904 RepID=A0ABS3X1G5_9ACTN|nr:pentapeptide repeat-containing protein [Streptomyces spirodelae]MBO8189196.1 pentapeptide repeat-containing protein [Streptomyces spirodelae]
MRMKYVWGSSEKRGLRLWPVGTVLALAFAAALTVVSAVFFTGWGLLDAQSLKPERQVTSKTLFELVKLSFGVVAGAGALVALVVAYRRQRLDEDAALREATRLHTERFSTAVSQLGEGSPAIRLGGVHALAGLADDAPTRDLRQTCIDVLCAYLRLPYTQKEHLPQGDQAARHNYVANREVRHTVIRVIRDRLRLPQEHPHSWQGHDLDFTSVVFDGGDFSGAVFPQGRVSFDNAVFARGFVTFGGASFCGAIVSFDHTDFSDGLVTFDHATFSGGRVSFNHGLFSGGTVDFVGATFSGSAIFFDRARFTSSKISFNRARFTSGGLSFDSAELLGGAVRINHAKLAGAEISFADFLITGGRLVVLSSTLSAGRIDFSGALIDGGRVTFTRSHLLGAEISFENTDLSRGTVSFDRAELQSGKIGFDQAQFGGVRVTFKDTVFSGTHLSFSNEQPPPPGVCLPPTWQSPPQ